MSTRPDGVDPDVGPPPESYAALDDGPRGGLSVDVSEASRYATLGVLGRGGMGRVTTARDARLGRVVARKEALPGHEQRLVAEASLAARLDHPGILPVLDAGRTADGQPFYTMSVGPGRTLQDELQAHDAPAARRPLVRSLLHASEAVAHAHRRGVVHRDLKPSNLLVGELGVVRVTDWGLAAEVGAPGRRAEGTPGFASPEQLAGAAADPRQDVWSLGVMLREVLSGRDGSGWSAAPAELRAITTRALAADPGDRYADAGALVLDLAAWFDGDRVGAHDYSAAELLVRAARAWRWPLSLGAVALIGASLATGMAYEDMRASRDRALQANERATDALGRSLAVQATFAARREAWPEAAALARRALDTRPTAEARGALAAVATAVMPTSQGVPRVDSCTLVVPAVDGHAWLCSTGAALQRWELGATAPTWSARVAREVSWSGPDGLVIARHPDFRTSLVIDASTGATRAEVPVHEPTAWSVQGQGRAAVLADEHALEIARPDGVTIVPVDCPRMLTVAWSVDGQDLWVACADGRLLAGPPEGPLVERMRREGPALFAEPSAVAAWPDGRVALGHFGGQIVRLDAHGGVEGVDDPGLGPVRQILGAPGRSWMAVRGEVSGLAILDRESGAVRHRLDEDVRGPMTRDADAGQLIAFAADVRRWDLPDRAPLTRIVSHAGLGTGAWLADGARLALASGDGSVSVWPVREGGPPIEYRWQPSVVKGLVARGDAVVAVATEGRSFHLLEDGREAPGPTTLSHGARRVGRVGGATWMVPFLGAPVWVPDDGATTTLPLPRALDGADAPSGQLAVLRTDDALWRLDARGELTRLDVPVRPEDGPVAIADDGRVALAQGAQLWVHGAAGAPFALAAPSTIDDVAWGPRGALAVGTRDGVLCVWLDPRADATPWMVHRGHDDRVSWVGFSPDGQQIATASWDGTARVWTLP